MTELYFLGWKFEIDDAFGMQVGALKYYYGDGETRCLQQVTNVVEAHKNQQNRITRLSCYNKLLTFLKQNKILGIEC